MKDKAVIKTGLHIIEKISDCFRSLVIIKLQDNGTLGCIQFNPGQFYGKRNNAVKCKNKKKNVLEDTVYHYFYTLKLLFRPLLFRPAQSILVESACHC
jgi:hypothetical protein